MKWTQVKKLIEFIYRNITKEGDRLYVNAVKGRKSLNKSLYDLWKTRRSECVNEKWKKVLWWKFSSVCVCVCVCLNEILPPGVQCGLEPGTSSRPVSLWEMLAERGFDLATLSLYTTLTPSSCGHQLTYFSRYGK